MHACAGIGQDGGPTSLITFLLCATFWGTPLQLHLLAGWLLHLSLFCVVLSNLTALCNSGGACQWQFEAHKLISNCMQIEFSAREQTAAGPTEQKRRGRPPRANKRQKNLGRLLRKGTASAKVYVWTFLPPSPCKQVFASHPAGWHCLDLDLKTWKEGLQEIESILWAHYLYKLAHWSVQSVWQLQDAF